MDTDTSSDMSDERGRIPNLIKIGSVPVDTQIDVETDVLEPVVSSQTFARFVLERKGFMHSFSSIVFGLKENASALEGSLPANIGVNSLVSKCSLKCGTTTISECEDFSFLQGYKSMFIDNEVNYERETYTTSRIMNHSMILKLDQNAQDLNNASYYGLSNHEEGGFATSLGSFAGYDTRPNLENRNGNTPQFRISLADLFPFLRFNQLPLYMFNEQISIELHFSPQTFVRTQLDSTETANSGTPIEIDLTELKLVSDYLFYDQDLMVRYQNANQNMNFNFTDWRLNKRSLTADQGQSKVVMNVGGAGRIVNKIVCGLFEDGNGSKTDCSILNVYTPKAPVMTGNNNALLTTNLRYNDTYIYPIDITSPTIQFHNVVRAEGNIPYVTREEYSLEGRGAVTDLEFSGYPQNSNASGLSGNFFWNAYKLPKNERVNSRGIELEVQYGKMNENVTSTHRCWVELMKTATLTNGLLTCYFA